MGSKTKLSIEVPTELYDRFRLIYSEHGDVSRFFRSVLMKTLYFLREHKMSHRDATTAAVESTIKQDLERGRIG